MCVLFVVNGVASDDPSNSAASGSGSRQSSAELFNIKERIPESGAGGETDLHGTGDPVTPQAKQNGRVQKDSVSTANQNACNNNHINSNGAATAATSGGHEKCVTFKDVETRLIRTDGS